MQKITSQICRENDRVALKINGQIVPPVAYMTYLPERNHYKDFGDTGYRLFTTAVFFGGRGINAYSHIRPFARGIYDQKGKPDYTVFDETIEAIIREVPNCYIIPRVNVMMPEWWCRENPKDCNDTGVDGEAPRECFSSDKWRRDVQEMLIDFVRYVEKSKYSRYIAGYHIAGGNTEEWLAFDNQGSVGAVARERFQHLRAEGAFLEESENEEAAWYRYLSHAVAETIEMLAETVRRETGNRLIVGSFYGYLLEIPYANSGHHALERLLRSDKIDFFAAPSSYMERQPGKDWGCMTVLDSLTLHGKLFFSEYDTRTYLTGRLGEAREGACLPGTYEGGVWEGPSSSKISRALLKNNIARQLTHNTGSWWFDMWGGWFDDPDIMEDLRHYRQYVELSLSEPITEKYQPRVQLAVMVDERGYAHLPQDAALCAECCAKSRSALGLSGVPYAIFEIGDFAEIKDKYRAFVFLAPITLRRMKEAIAECRRCKIPFYVVNGESAPLQTGQIRKLARRGGVHIWCESDDVLYAGEGWLSIHTATAGEKVIFLPKQAAAMEVTGEVQQENAWKSREIMLQTEAYETRLFRLKFTPDSPAAAQTPAGTARA